MSIDFARLCAPFPVDRVSWRVGSTNKDKTRGLALAYIDARDVMERLDQVAGPENWQCTYPHADGKTVCSIALRIGDEWVGKADGAGDTDYEAEKGALSDAFKRAAVRWGIGRYLYDIDAAWVAVEPAGKSFRIADSEYPRLRQLLAKHGASADAGKSTNTESDSRAVATDLIAELREIKMAKPLQAWASRLPADARFVALSDADKERVRSAFRSHTDHIKNNEAALV